MQGSRQGLHLRHVARRLAEEEVEFHRRDRGTLQRGCGVPNQDRFQADLVHPPPDFDEERLGIHDGISITDESGRGADFPVLLGGESVRYEGHYTFRLAQYLQQGHPKYNPKFEEYRGAFHLLGAWPLDPDAEPR